MDPVSAKEMAAALAVFVTMIEKLGAGGLLGLVFGCPLLIIGAFWGQSWSDRNHNRKMFEETRKSVWDLWEKHRGEMARLQEEHRREAADIIKKFDESLEKTTRYYEDNVSLVQNYERLNGELQNLIVTTIQTLVRVEAHFDTLCQAVRK